MRTVDLPPVDPWILEKVGTRFLDTYQFEAQSALVNFDPRVD